MTRVLQVTAVPLTMRVFVVPLAEALVDLGYQVEWACGGPERCEFSPFPGYHLLLSRVPFHPLNGRGLWQLVRLMRARRYDVVHVHTPTAGVVGRIAARIAQVPLVIYTLHGSFWGTRPRWRAVLFDRLERALALWTSHVFVLNDDDAADLLNHCYLVPEQVTRLPVGGAGVDLDAFDPPQFPPERVSQLRRELGLGDSNAVVGYVGRLDRDKGIRDLLQAFARLRKNRPQVRLLLVGERIAGDRDALADELLAELGAAVVCTGFRDDVPAMIACMDVIVSPSRRDGFGMVLAEAAAMGKPVVATATRGARAAVGDCATGLLAPVGDVDVIAKQVERLLTDPEMRARMGRTARQRAIERFDRRKVMKIYQTVYTRLLAS
jgi:glycosyltransferase involved in cell wall biosynthesis